MANIQRSFPQLSRATSLLISRRTQSSLCRRLLLTNTLRPILPSTSFPCIRTLSTTIPRSAALADQLPAQPTVVLQTPSSEYIEKEELDVELIPPEQIELVITDRAAEVSSLIYSIYSLQY